VTSQIGRRLLGPLVALLALAALLAALNALAARDLPRLFEGGWLLSKDFPPAADPELRCTFVPNLNLAPHPYFGVAIHTNAQGFRTAPFTPKGGQRRVVVLGDSIAFGAFLEESENLAARLAQALAAHGATIEVFNLGVPTYNMREKVAAFRVYGAALRPDAVLLQSKPGDFENSRALAVAPWMKRAPLALWLLARWRQAQPVRDTDAGIEALNWLAKQCADRNAVLLAAYFPFLVAVPFDDVWREDRAQFARADVKLLDVGGALSRERTDLTVFRARPHDAMHPNERAIELAAETAAEELAPALRGGAVQAPLRRP
jgi:lysophospholipase L1-like esterase